MPCACANNFSATSAKKFNVKNSRLSGGTILEASSISFFLSFILIISGVLLGLLLIGPIQFANNESKYLASGMTGAILMFLFVYIIYLNFNRESY